MGKYTYKQRAVDNAVYSIDKRQYMRFGANDGQAPVRLAENTQIDSLVDISRGGIAVRHHNDLKVGDVVPVQISCGNLDFTADVKVVSATSRRAGAEFINLDQATANKILYLNIMLEEQTAAKRLNNKNLSFVR
ncbi:membrane PilZ domain protein Epm44 [Clostridium sp. CAG:967]|nr:membrane PilZ domain protein Epm44 [Clostridium sp. CAG:967]